MEFISSTPLHSCLYEEWECFLEQSLGTEWHPIFCQSIGNAVLENLIQEECPIVEADQVLSNEQQPLMTVEELNALICSRLYYKSLSKEVSEVSPSTKV